MGRAGPRGLTAPSPALVSLWSHPLGHCPRERGLGAQRGQGSHLLPGSAPTFLHPTKRQEVVFSHSAQAVVWPGRRPPCARREGSTGRPGGCASLEGAAVDQDKGPRPVLRPDGLQSSICVAGTQRGR